MQVQDYLRAKTAAGLDPIRAVADLTHDFAIRSTFHPSDPLVILTYDQINSPKTHPIVCECRSLTLELGTWNVVARAFPRFFNEGECLKVVRKFDWVNFSAEEKCDGSLLLLYRYRGLWRVQTRRTFATGEIAPGVGKTWEEAFYETVDEVGLDDLANLPQAERRTFVFELCTPYNKVVRAYDRPTSFLLTSFHNQNGSEWHENTCDIWAETIRALRPTRYDFTNLQQIRDFLDAHSDPTFEGLVLRDRHGTRLKVKSSRYVALHRLKNNGNLFHPKNLIPLALKGEATEVINYLPEVAGPYFDVVGKLFGPHGRMLAVWEVAKEKESQKDFALFVKQHTKLAPVLFEARKRGVSPDEVFRGSEDYLVKVFGGGQRAVCPTGRDVTEV